MDFSTTQIANTPTLTRPIHDPRSTTHNLNSQRSALCALRNPIRYPLSTIHYPLSTFPALRSLHYALSDPLHLYFNAYRRHKRKLIRPFAREEIEVEQIAPVVGVDERGDDGHLGAGDEEFALG